MNIQKYWNFQATVVKVIDGDTIDFDVDLGFFVHVSVRTRLLGINAPETSTAEGKITRDWLRLALPVGTVTMITTTKVPGDKYGRWLATIDAGCVSAEMNPEGIPTINELLVSKGYAVPYMV